MKTRLLLALCALPAIVSCNGSSASKSPPAIPQQSAVERVVATIERMPAFAGRLGGRDLVRVEGGYALPRKGFRPTGNGVRVVAPKHASEPLRFEESESGFTVEIADTTLGSTDGVVRGGAVVYPGAAPEGDLAQLIDPTSAEEIRVLRKPALTTIHYAIHTSAGASVALRADRVELYDRFGRLRVASAPMFAVDDRGQRRAPTVSLSGSERDFVLTVTHDTRDMTAPIALDPRWELTSGTALPSAVDQVIVTVTPTHALLLSTPYSYNAVTDTWTARPAVNHGTTDFTATLVPSLNTLLIAGGSPGGGTTNRSSLYNFASGYTLTASGLMTTARINHSAVLLGDGGSVPERVFVVGGRPGGSGGFASTEWWDPGTGTWSSRASMASARWRFGLTLFTDSMGKQKVLAAGGHNGVDAVASAEVYDPIGNVWTAVANNMAQARWDHVTVTLPNNKVLVAGGALSTYCCATTETTSIYDPATNTFSAGASMNYKRGSFSGVLLSDGRVLVAGGYGHRSGTTDADAILKTTELYDPATNTWTNGPDLSTPRRDFGMTWLSSGRALVVGGSTTGGGYANNAEVFFPDPKVCTTTGPGCANCVDGYCCDGTCGGQCEACDLGGREGVCSNVNGEAPHGSRAACSPYVTCAYSTSTGTSSCATTCTGDTACAPTSFCSGGACVAKKTNGAACTGANQCVSGNCVDGFCCESSCTGQCSACGEPGNEGKCIAVDGAPRGARTACTTTGYGCVSGACGTTCTKDAHCLGANYCSGGACVPKLANGSTCTANTQCSSGACSDGYCCAAACTGTCSSCGPSGTCGATTGVPLAPKTCGAYLKCSAGACATSCSADTDCTSGFFCNTSSRCVVRKALGAACLGNSECTSGFCANGVCCNSACGSECEACNLTGTVGTCTVKAAGTSCGLAGCVGGYAVAASTCDGRSNTCPLGAIAPCPNGLKCLDKTACRSTCTSDADCQTGTCDTTSGKCASAWDGGGIDTGGPDTELPDTTASDSSAPDTSVADTSVADTTVVDTTAPDTAPPADTASPADTLVIAEVGAPPFKDQTKVVGEFTRCTKAADCPSGHCVEGVCCDTECKDRCHSCALLTAPGKCTLEPIGVDLKNECGPALACLGTCGATGECIGSGTGTMCARNRCTGAITGVGPAYCAGPGAPCNDDEAVPFNCSPFICEPAFGACRSTCNDSNDCAQGFVCDVPSKSCIAAPAAATTDDGGGGCAVSPTRSSGGALLLVIALAALRRRRDRHLA